MNQLSYVGYGFFQLGGFLRTPPKSASAEVLVASYPGSLTPKVVKRAEARFKAGVTGGRG